MCGATCVRHGRLVFVVVVMASWVWCGAAPDQAVNAAPPRDAPNVVIFLTDDQGWGDLSINGNRNLSTPHIDSLATDGAILDRFFVSPVCSPTRAEFLTGRYHTRGGVYGTSAGGERLDLDEMTIAQTFQRAGYATGAFGKWHNGSQWPYHPNARGFNEFYGFCSGHWAEYFDWQLENNGHFVQGQGYVIDDLTDHAMAFIEDHAAEPFFCYLPYNTPHSPMQVPDRFYDRFADVDVAMRNRNPDAENPLMTRAALAMCENIDWNVGRVLDKLAELKLADNTIVIYFADNGPNSWRWNGDMKGRKGATDEGGVRSPCLVRWPGHIAAGTKVAEITAAIDLLPTLADLVGIPVASQKELDGKSLKPLLLASGDRWPERMLFSHWNKRVSVRTERFRLDHQGQLFDMVEDPGQRSDVAAQHPAVTTQLSEAAERWRAEMLPGLRDDDRPFPVGYRQFPVTVLPARDGIPSGAIERSNRFPNSTYFLNWSNTQDEIAWDIEVAQSGTYQMTVYYACPASDVGARFECRFLESVLTARIEEAHDPPLVGPAHDRVPRIEGPTKKFKPLDVGVIRLPAGRGKLTLRAVEIPGQQVMELQYVVLTLLQP